GPGPVVLREVPQAGWEPTLPPTGVYTFAVVSGVGVTRDFGNRSATIAGTAFQDTNGNGARDAGEPGQSGWRVFLDRNDNGALDACEPSLLTDTAGGYTFTGLTPRTYVVRAVVQTGWVQTAPAGGSYRVVVVDAGTTATGRDFGHFRLATVSGV